MKDVVLLLVTILTLHSASSELSLRFPTRNCTLSSSIFKIRLCVNNMSDVARLRNGIQIWRLKLKANLMNESRMRVQIDTTVTRTTHYIVPVCCESRRWRSHGGATAQPRRDSSDDDDDAQSSWSSDSSSAATSVTAVPAAAVPQPRCAGKRQSKALPWCRTAMQDYVKIVHVA